MRRTKEASFLLLAAAGVALGGALYAFGRDGGAHAVWAVTTVVGVVPATWWVMDAARHRRLGVDVVALLALIGTLVVHEYFAGAVVTVMLASGRTLAIRGRPDRGAPAQRNSAGQGGSQRELPH